jgi:predicted DNA-binding antitoxin AbrB/MazE fold protein
MELFMQSLLIQAVYENGVLKPDRPLPLAEHERVQVSIHPALQQPCSEITDDPVRASYGMLGWKGDAETVERLALDPEFGVEEAP